MARGWCTSRSLPLRIPTVTTGLPRTTTREREHPRPSCAARPSGTPPAEAGRHTEMAAGSYALRSGRGDLRRRVVRRGKHRRRHCSGTHQARPTRGRSSRERGMRAMPENEGTNDGKDHVWPAALGALTDSPASGPCIPERPPVARPARPCAPTGLAVTSGDVGPLEEQDSPVKQAWGPRFLRRTTTRAAGTRQGTGRDRSRCPT
jgi:hypothetical protein